MDKKYSQKEIILEVLRQDPEKKWDCGSIIGDHKVFGTWQYITYKAQSRLTELNDDKKVHRKEVKGKTSRKYYIYWHKKNGESHVDIQYTGRVSL